MTDASRRSFLGALALGAGGVASCQALAAGSDGHAAGYDAVPASDFMPKVPRKSGDPVTFTASLDRAAIKATSGGWAREITTRSLPIATDMAIAHLFLNPGGSREMHWHNAAEWAYVLAGYCQVVVVDPNREVDVTNLAPGDLWYFPKGHSHSIQTLGSNQCHAILAFDDGLYSEHGTFGISDWMSRLEPATLAQAFGVPVTALARIPEGETYINQGMVLAHDGPEARSARELGRARTHRYRLLAQKPHVQSAGGTFHLASAREFPVSTTITGWLMRLQPGAMHKPHWHPNASEWHYVAKGRVQVMLFATDKRMAVAEISTGDSAYVPRGCGHLIRNTGTEECEIVGMLDSGAYQESTLVDWMAKAPGHVIANNLGFSDAALAPFRNPGASIAAARGDFRS
jgi:oxalate decarboxylase